MDEVNEHTPVDRHLDLYNKIKVGKKFLEDAVLDLESVATKSKYFRGNSRLGSKTTLMQALSTNDSATIRLISDYFYRSSGIYQKVCNYFATLYRYDWYVVPEVYKDNVGKEKILKDFHELLGYYDDSYLKDKCGKIALKVIKNGVYYGYVTDSTNMINIQELPIEFCRSRYSIGDSPAVEFNLDYFDSAFTNPSYRLRVLKLWPKEFYKAYLEYKNAKLDKDKILQDEDNWYLLDPDRAFKFSVTSDDLPLFVNAIPDIIDLDISQDIEHKKQLQKLAKIIVQKVPLDKNGDLLFSGEEVVDLHKNAVEMLRDILGVDVLTSFMDVKEIDMSDASNVADKSLENAERSVYNALGVTKNLFNTDGNLSVEKSILSDAGSIRTLLLQMDKLFNKILTLKIKGNKKYRFRFHMLETTQYNYKDLAKVYKEHVQLGYSKILPQLAMGHSQSEILATLHFENEILNLGELMVPPTMNGITAKDKDKNTEKPAHKTQIKVDEDNVGRPPKEEGEKSDKTLANEESQK